MREGWKNFIVMLLVISLLPSVGIGFLMSPLLGITMINFIEGLGYLSDFLMGLIVGLIIGIFYTKYMRKIERERNIY